MERSFIWQRHLAQMTPRGEVEWVELCEVIYRVEREATKAKLYGPPEDCYEAEPAEILIVAVYDKDGEDQIHGLTDEEAEAIYEMALEFTEESDTKPSEDDAYDKWQQKQLDEDIE